MIKYIKTLVCVFSVIVLTIVKANAQVLPDVQNSLNQYNANNLQEKLFLHTDKNTYTAGELMWFKVYCVDGTNHNPVDLSKVVYVEVLDNNQNPVLQGKIAMKNGSGTGSLYIPVTLATGNFLLRAYTSWMKNYSPEYYFHKQLTIVNPLKTPEAQPEPSAERYDIQFFPEGGNLVNGISSVVAFKANNQWGKGVAFKGAVLDKNNDTVTRFEAFKFGMGHFTFKPDNNAAPYRAVIKIGGGVIQKDMPTINTDGYVMQLKDNGQNQLLVTVNTNPPNRNVYLFAHTRGTVKDIETALTDNGIARFTIDKNKLGDGISHLTIFNDARQAVCERLYFKRPLKNLVIMAAADQQAYATRKKVNIAIDAKDESSNPVSADLSLSVYRLDSLQHPDQENIQNYLWLSSDLRGNIESPEYYFKDGADRDEATDNLMLTQGWSRFEWGDVLQHKAPAFTFLPEFNGPIINARLTNTTTGTPQKEIVAYLGIPGKSVQLYAATSDSLGRLIFNMKDFYGPGEIVVQTNTEIDTTFHIDVLNAFSEQYAKISLPYLTIPPGYRTAFQEHSLGTQLQNIYNANKLRQFYDPGVDSSAFYGKPDDSYLLDNYTRFLTMEEVMREYVKEAFVSHLHNRFHIKTINEGTYMPDGDPMMLIDGIPFFNLDKVFAVDPLKIRKLEVVPYTYYWGPSSEEGIFSFTSYKGDLGGAEIDPHAVVLDYEGLQLQREFYSPAYDTDKAYNSRIPDFRDVLYWAPYVTTSVQGKNSLSFYTSDQTGKYIGIIQGITANGTCGSQYFMFNVNK